MRVARLVGSRTFFALAGGEGTLPGFVCGVDICNPKEKCNDYRLMRERTSLP